MSEADGVLNNDTDIDGDDLTVASATVDINGDGSQQELPIGTPTTITSGGVVAGVLTLNSDGSYKFAPEANWSGDVPLITYTVSDGANTETAQLQIDIKPVTDDCALELGDLNNNTTPDDGNIRITNDGYEGMNQTVVTINSNAVNGSKTPIADGGLMAKKVDELIDNGSSTSKTITGIDAKLYKATFTDGNGNSINQIEGFTSKSSSNNNANASISEGVVEGTARLIEAWIYLKKDDQVGFKGYTDDQVKIELAGKDMVWGNRNDAYASFDSTKDTSPRFDHSGMFTVPEDGYYSLKIYNYNYAGTGAFDILMTTNGSDYKDINTTNFDLYASIADVSSQYTDTLKTGLHSDESDTSTNNSTGVDSDEGEGYYTFALNEGIAGQEIEINSINFNPPNGGDTSTSLIAGGIETMTSMTLSGLPAGAMIKDNQGHLTIANGDGVADIMGFNYADLTISTDKAGDYTVTVTKTHKDSTSLSDQADQDDETASTKSCEVTFELKVAASTVATPAIEIVTDANNDGIITTDDNLNVTNPELNGNLIEVKVTVVDVDKLQVGDTITITGPIGNEPEVIVLDSASKLANIKSQLNNGGLTREYLRPVGSEDVGVKVTIQNDKHQASATDNALLAQPFDVLTHVELRTKKVTAAGVDEVQIINPETGATEGTMNDTNPDNDYRIAQGQLPKTNMHTNGRHIAKVVHNGNDYTADANGIITIPNTAEGGTLEINSNTGEYTYKLANTAFTADNNGDQDSFKIVTADKDGGTRELESDFKVQIDKSQAYDRTVTKGNVNSTSSGFSFDTENGQVVTHDSPPGFGVSGNNVGGATVEIGNIGSYDPTQPVSPSNPLPKTESLKVNFDYLVGEAEVKISWLYGRDPSTGKPRPNTFQEQAHIYFLDENGERIIDPISSRPYRYTQVGGTDGVDSLGEIRLPTGELFRGLEFTVPADSVTGENTHNSDYLINEIRIIKSYELEGIDGGDDSEYIYGDASDDKISGFAGHDNIVALAGDDYIDSGAGNDIIKAGAGDDIVRAGDGDDYIEAGAGDDLIDGGAGNDDIKAGAGNDVIIYDNADGKVDGGIGLDTLYLNKNETIDFANLANKVDSIETIESKDSVTFTLNNITAQDVLDVSDNDKLFIQGNTDDKVSVAGWNANGNHTEGSGVEATQYSVYTNGGATLYIEDGIQIL